jgi:hypothetical protein
MCNQPQYTVSEGSLALAILRLLEVDKLVSEGENLHARSSFRVLYVRANESAIISPAVALTPVLTNSGGGAAGLAALLEHEELRTRLKGKKVVVVRSSPVLALMTLHHLPLLLN